MAAFALIRIAHIGACVLLFGVLAFELRILRPSFASTGGAEFGPSLSRSMSSARLAAVVVAFAAWLAWIAELAAQMSGLPYAQALQSGALATVVRDTTFGQVWLIRAGLMVVLGAVLLFSARAGGSTGPWLRTAAALAGITLASLAWSGHALGAHREHAFIDALHALAAGLWVGMLAPLLWTLRRSLVSAQPGSARWAASAARRFSLPGIAAVIALALTGPLNAWWLVGSWSALVTSGYGILVTCKIACFAAMILLALTNRFLWVPRIEALAAAGSAAARPLRAMSFTVALELTFGVAILVIVGVLGITPPAAHEHSSHPMHHVM